MGLNLKFTDNPCGKQTFNGIYSFDNEDATRQGITTVMT